MRIIYVTKDQRLTAHIESETQKRLFKELATFQEVCEHEACGKCQSDDTVFSVREVQNNEYYEKKCRSCGAALSFGQSKDTKSLFPKRKKEDGSWDNEHKGWSKWEPSK